MHLLFQICVLYQFFCLKKKLTQVVSMMFIMSADVDDRDAAHQLF